jgi:hypothetical protein
MSPIRDGFAEAGLTTESQQFYQAEAGSLHDEHVLFEED